MPAIRLDAATIGYRGHTVLRQASLHVEDGEFVGLLGPNGAGKTTLLRALLGLVPATTGQLEVLGTPARRGNPGIGYLPQTAGPALRLTGQDLLAIAARGTGWGLPLAGADVRREVARALALVEATPLARRPLAELSGGERQRVLLAQALLGRPRLLLLDEPLISLDPRHQHGVVACVKSLQRELGLTVLFSAHELNPLLGAMDRVLYVGGGHAAIGTVDAVVTGPVLSRLYGTEIEVVRAANRIFVLLDGSEMTPDSNTHRPLSGEPRRVRV